MSAAPATLGVLGNVAAQRKRLEERVLVETEVCYAVITRVLNIVKLCCMTPWADPRGCDIP